MRRQPTRTAARRATRPSRAPRAGLVSALLVAVMLVAGPALADDVPSPDTATAGADLVLAAEEGPVLGPDPQPRDREDNVARELAGFEDRDVPFTWGAAWILSFAGLVGLVMMAGLYWLLVHRPSQTGRQPAGKR